MSLTNLVPPLTSFIGRTQELTEIEALLERTRLLTLTGVGGCGKTRLAMQLASNLLAANLYPDGIWWVDLVGLNDSGLVTQVVAQTLDIREVPDTLDLIDAINSHLAGKQMLLVFDNCEHLLLDCRQLAQRILSSCTTIQILATSREALGVAGELTWLVPSLTLPDLPNFPVTQSFPAHTVAQNDAIRLFVERASTIVSSFKLTDEVASSIALICKRLDGLPLAIELAAARVNILTAQQIADRLNDRFALLTGGNRTALIPRHQTLRTTMDWSYELLSKQEQALFRRLSVFAGGFELEAAEAICSGDEVEVKDVLDLLSHLIDKSLVIVAARESNVARYRLLETIRQYASERLTENHETENLHQPHASFFLKLAEKAKPELNGPNQQIWFERLDKEKDNSRLALNWLLENDIEAAARLASGLFWLWHTYGYWSEGRKWYNRLLKSEMDLHGQKPLTRALRAQALYEAGWLAADDRDQNQAQSLSEQSLAIYRELEDKGGMAMAINTLGWVAFSQSDYSRAKTLAEESLTLFMETGLKFKFSDAFNLLGGITQALGFYDQAKELYKECLKWAREIGDKPPAAYALSAWGYLDWLQGNLEEAEILTEEGLQLSREARLDWNIPYALTQLGDIARAQGEYDKSARFYDECDVILKRLGNQRERGYLLWSRGWLARLQGNNQQATGFFKEGLMLWQKAGDKHRIAECLEGLAGVGIDLGKAELAANLMGTAEIIREETNSPLPPVDQANYDRDIAAIRSQLGESNYIKAWAEGRQLKMEKAIEEAMRIESRQKSPMSFTAQPVDSPERLNARELEILRLIAKGFANNEIADQLVLAVSTVKWYINNIFGKLHVRNRTQAVARARELKLL